VPDRSFNRQGPSGLCLYFEALARYILDLQVNTTGGCMDLTILIVITQLSEKRSQRRKEMKKYEKSRKTKNEKMVNACRMRHHDRFAKQDVLAQVDDFFFQKERNATLETFNQLLFMIAEDGKLTLKDEAFHLAVTYGFSEHAIHEAIKQGKEVVNQERPSYSERMNKEYEYESLLEEIEEGNLALESEAHRLQYEYQFSTAALERAINKGRQVQIDQAKGRRLNKKSTPTTPKKNGW
jgi:hypothetical protein